MTLVRLYVDAFNLYHAIDALGDNRLKWLNFHALGKGLLREGETLDAVHWFSAVWRFDQAKQKRHQNFIAAQRAYGVIVHEGNFKRSHRWCEKHERSCPFREEKQTDVAISVQMLVDAFDNTEQRHILVTADSDQIPTVRALSSMQNVKMTLAYPPNRKAQARELGSLFSDIIELKPGRLLTCMLPRNVFANGELKATVPAAYGIY